MARAQAALLKDDRVAHNLFASLGDAEQAIVNYSSAYQLAAEALIEIHEHDLWTQGDYESFEQYIAERWGYTKSRASQLENAGSFVRYLRMNCDGMAVPESERVVREIMRIKRRKERKPPYDFAETEDQVMERRRQAWVEIQDMAENNECAVTAELAAAVVDRSFRGGEKVKKAKALGPTVKQLEVAFSKILDMRLKPQKAVNQFGAVSNWLGFAELYEWMRECKNCKPEK